MTVPFGLGEVPPLSRSGVARDEQVRADPEHAARLWKSGRVILLDKRLRTPVEKDPLRLVYRPCTDFGEEPVDGAVLLGMPLDEREQSFWALPQEAELIGEVFPPADSWGLATGAVDAEGLEWHDLRGIGSLLDDTEAGLLTTATALLNWHHRAGFCARDGSPVRVSQCGWATKCEKNGHEEYPRTDPAIICLVHDGAGGNGEQVLLARQPVWPAERYSVLAGFVEAGESMEACVAREIMEEVGVPVRDIRYLGSQPWPFPRSLMIGFAAVADPSVPLRPAEGEIEQAKWVSKETVRAAIAAGGAIEGLKLPGETSIARQMLSGWARS